MFLKMKSPKLLTKILPFTFIFIVTLLFFYPVWVQGKVPLPADIVVGSYFPWLDYKWGYEVGVPVKNPITSDAISFSYPMRTLAIDLLKSGQWPLWNPYILFGTPLLANFQSAPFSVTNFVYFFFDKLTAWSVQIILQHALAAVFTYLLLRFWGIGKVAASLGGLIFAFSGFNLIWSQWNSLALGASFIPLIILFTELMLQQGKLKYGVFISLSIALQIFAGYPQIVFYSLLSVAALFFVRFRSLERKIFNIVFLAVFMILGLSLTSVQSLPGYELIQLSQRNIESVPIEWAFLSWEQIITFIAPDYFGNHATNNYWGPKNYTSNVGFVGVVAVVLAVFSLSNFKKIKEIRFAALLGAVSLLLAFPNPLSIFIWESNFFGMSAGISHRSLVLFNLSIALLAGFGINYFLQGKRVKPIWLTLAYILPTVTIVCFGAYSTVLYFLSQKSPDFFPQDVGGIPIYFVAIRNLILPLFLLLFVVFVVSFFKNKRRIIGVSLLFLLTMFELFRFGWKFTPFSPRHIVYPNTPVLDFLLSNSSIGRVNGGSVIPTNLTIPYKIETPGGYDAVYPRGTAKFLGVLNSNDSGANEQDRYGNVTLNYSKLLNLVNVEYLLVKKEKDVEYIKQNYENVFEDKSVAVLRNNNASPRAFMVYQWTVLENERIVLDKLLDPTFPKDKTIVLDRPVPGHQSGEGAEQLNVGDLGYNVSYLDYGDQESKLEVSTPVGGLLFVSDTFYPGWKAYIDENETEILRADFNFRAVYVPKGVHMVEFYYKPESFYNGVKISLLSVLILGMLLIASKYHVKKI